MKKRILSMLLVLAMVLSMIPVMASAAATPSIEQVSMTLSGILDVNFKLASNGGDMSLCSLEVTGAVEQTITDYTKDGDLYVYTAKVPAHKLPETLSVKVIYDGAEVESHEWTAEADYLSKLTGSDTLTALAAALANYGTYAAAYANGTENADIDGITAEKLQVYKPEIIVSNSALVASASLYLDDAADLKVKFRASAWEDGYKLLIDGVETAVTAADDKMVASIEELLPQDWTKMYDIQVVSGEEVIFQCTYGVNSYIYQQLGKSVEAQTGLNNLLKSMYAYGVAAVAYAPATRTPIALGSINIRDPFILNDGDAYYLYGTGGSGKINAWSSNDLQTWYSEGACMTIAEGDEYYDTTNSEVAFWAPEVHVYNGAYYMFVTFTQAGTGTQQGTAIMKADSPLGPFEKWSDGFVTPSGHSCLDGTLYIENGVPYLIYAHEWECAECDDDMGSMAYIQLTDDLKSSTGSAVELFDAEDLTGYSWFQTTFGSKENAKVTDGPFVYTDDDGQKYLLWSSSVDDGNYVQVYTTFDTLSGGINAGSNSARIYTDDGGHGMIFTDMNGVDKLILHTPNSSTSYPALFNVTAASGALSLEGVRLWDGYHLTLAYMEKAKEYTENTTVFIGDSFFDFDFWNTFYEDLEGMDVLTLAIGGTTVEDWNGYAFSGVLLDGTGAAPKNIVVNLGNNDYFNDGLTAEEALANYEEYFTRLHTSYPSTPLYVFSTVARTGSNANTDSEARMTAGNALLKTWCADKDWITFIDITGQIPEDGLYDGIHPSDEYYGEVYVLGLLDAGCDIASTQESDYYYVESTSGGATAYTENAAIVFSGDENSTVYFKANENDSYAKCWELTGSIAKSVLKRAYLSFGVKTASTEKWFTINAANFAISSDAELSDKTNLGLVSGTVVFNETACRYFYDSFYQTLCFKIVIENDHLKAYFWTTVSGYTEPTLALNIDLTSATYGGFDAGSNYQLAIADTIVSDSHLTVKAVSNVSVTTSDTANYQLISDLSLLNNASGNYRLAGNVTCDATISGFTGNLDGNGYTISTAVPVFSSLSSGSTIENLTIDLTADLTSTGILCSSTAQIAGVTLTDIAIISSGDYTLTGSGDCGAFMYKVGSNTVLTNCSNAVDVTRTVSGADVRMGGLVAYAESGAKFIGCSNSGDIYGSTNWRAYVGGLVGDSNTTTYTNCSNSGTVYGSFCAAGIACIVRTDTLVGCTNTGTVKSASAGGIVGRLDYGTITVTGCASLGTVEGTSDGGSLVAQNTGNYAALVLQDNTFGGTVTIAGVTYDPANRLHPTGVPAAKLTGQCNTYVITYELDGGVNNASNPATFAHGSTVTLAEPTKDGYVFQGWTSGGSAITEISTNGNITVTADWQEIKDIYTVTYESEIDCTHSNAASAEAGTVITLTDASSDDGIFLGWYNEAGEKVESVTVNEDITLTAKWTIYITSLSQLDGKTGSYALKQDITNDATVSSFGGTLYGNGHTVSTTTALFASLSSGAVIENLTVDLTADLSGTGILCSSTAQLGGLTLTNIAIISSGGYTLTGSSDCGAFMQRTASGTVLTNCSNAVNVTRTASGVDIKMGGLVAYAHSGSKFVGCSNSGDVTASTNWRAYVGGIVGDSNTTTYTNCSNSGNVGNDFCSAGIVCIVRNDTVTGCTNSGTVTGEAAGGIVGRLESGTINVTNCASLGNIVGTSGGGSIIAQYTGNYTTIHLEGNTFGDNTATLGGVTYPAANRLHPTGMTAITGQMNTYVITYVLDGGVNNASNPATYGHGGSVTLAEPTKDGYEFLGWTSGGKSITTVSGNADVTVTATWQEIKEVYTVTYEGIDGATNPNATSYEDGTVVALADASMDGSAFAGWFDASGNYVESITVDRDITLTAKWGTGITDLSEIDGQSGTYVLTADTTLSAAISTFSGTLYGKGHTVSTATAVFTALGNDTTIQNLTIDLTADMTGTGILCASTSNIYRLTVTDVHLISTGGYTLTGSANCGALMQKIVEGTVLTGCSNSVNLTRTVTNADIVLGGLVGYAYANTSIVNCTNNGTITASTNYRAYLAGIVGDAYAITIKGCVNNGNITANFNAAGIAGYVRGTSIVGCTNNGTITSSNVAGGIAGRLENGTIYITDCVSLGNIVATSGGGSIIAQSTGNYTTVILSGNTFGDNTATLAGVTYPAANRLHPTGIASISGQMNTYTITYNLDGGTNSASNPATFGHGTSVTLAEPTKDGYTFAGWVDASGNAVTTISTNADYVLTAQWTEN